MKISKLSGLVIGSAAAVMASVANSAPAQRYQCYHFDNMAEDANYTVGDVIDTQHATITIKQYVTNGNPATAATRRAELATSQIAGGSAPELGLYLVSVNVVPKKPVNKVRTRLAQSISQTGGFANANIEVNGEKHESPAGFAGMDGKTIGRPGKGGRAKIRTAVVPPSSGNWHQGPLELKANKGQIRSFTLGGHTWRIDDMCFGF